MKLRYAAIAVGTVLLATALTGCSEQQRYVAEAVTSLPAERVIYGLLAGFFVWLTFLAKYVFRYPTEVFDPSGDSYYVVGFILGVLALLYVLGVIGNRGRLRIIRRRVG